MESIRDHSEQNLWDIIPICRCVCNRQGIHQGNYYNPDLAYKLLTRFSGQRKTIHYPNSRQAECHDHVSNAYSRVKQSSIESTIPARSCKGCGWKNRISQFKLTSMTLSFYSQSIQCMDLNGKIEEVLKARDLFVHCDVFLQPTYLSCFQI